MRRTIIVTGVGGPAGRAGASYFREKGYTVVGTDMREVASPAAVFHRVPAARDPAFACALLDVVARERAALVVPTVTEELPVAARLREALREHGCTLCLSGPAGIDVANDKLATVLELERRGVAVPSTLAGQTAHAEVAATFGFPLLSKPRFGRGGRGVLVHRTLADLERANPEEEVVWQEFLPGEEFDVNLFAERDGPVTAAVVLRKTSLRDGLVGNAQGVERVERGDIRTLAVAAARALRLEGPLDVDVRSRTDGGPAVLEVNARIGANVLSAREVLEALDDAWRNGRCA